MNHQTDKTNKPDFNHLIQVSTMAKDATSYHENIKTYLGWDAPPTIHLEPNEFTRYYGKPQEMEAYFSFYPIEGIEFEVVSPLHGENIWKDYIQKRGDGLHHLLFNVVNFSDTVAFMEELGYPLAQSGRAVRKDIGDVRWGYFDTFQDHGFYVEIINHREVALSQKPKPAPPKKFIKEEQSLFHNLSHIGFVVRDLEATEKLVARLFAWELQDKSKVEACSNYGATSLHYQVSGIVISFTQPESGDSVWQEMLDKQGEGLHSVVFTVENLSSVEAWFQGREITPVQSGPSIVSQKKTQVFYDLRKQLGFYLAVLES